MKTANGPGADGWGLLFWSVVLGIIFAIGHAIAKLPFPIPMLLCIAGILAVFWLPPLLSRKRK
jgi:hypothetical protein